MLFNILTLQILVECTAALWLITVYPHSLLLQDANDLALSEKPIIEIDPKSNFAHFLRLLV